MDPIVSVRRTAHKRAELAGSAGAGVLGVGLGALLAQWVGPFAVLLLVLGVLLHGWGMVETHRLEAGAASPAWSKALYWTRESVSAGVRLSLSLSRRVGHFPRWLPT